MNNNISIISKIKMCSSCGACVSVCPKKSISLKESSIGRVFAEVDSSCIHCGLCLNVCPSFTCDFDVESFFSLEKYKVVVGKANNRNIYLNGQSGGAVTAILSYLFEMGQIDAALVCKMDDGGRGVPYVATNSSQLIQSQKSIYTPVPLLTDLESLVAFKSVAIVGLPCHLSGMRNLLKYKKIPISYMLGLICDRTLCNGVLDSISEYLKCGESKIMSIKWRDKSAPGFSYLNAPISVSLRDGKVRIIPSEVRQQIKKYFTPPRCSICPDKLNLSSDLVFGDPWNIYIEDTMGESLIIANTYKGYELLDNIINNKVISAKECTSEQLDKSQHIKERMEQISLYSRMFSLCSNNQTFLFDVKMDKKPSLAELARALYGVMRFRTFELLPKVWVDKYVANKIASLCDVKD